MKKNLILSLFLFSIAVSFAQSKPRQTPAEKAPTQQDMQEMTKEAQKMMDEMSPEMKKMMEDAGMKVPDMKTIGKKTSGITDAQLKKAMEDENRLVPVKDMARISAISKTALTDATLAVFLTSVHSKVITQLKPAAKQKGEEIYQLIKKEYSTDVATGNAAASLWMLGRAELAIYILGKVCADNPSNSNNLNNYASMLSMSGAEQLAIPFLDNLNKRFPENSTILNNLGQAWFGLGDIEKSEKYIDNVLRIYGYHPQANITKSFIEENKGHKAEAIEAMKRSVKHAYTKEKEDRLRKMGYKLQGKEVPWPYKINPDPLGLSAFRHPKFPASVDESIVLEEEWTQFKKECTSEITKLNFQYKQAEEFSIREDERRKKEAMNEVKNAIEGKSITGSVSILPFFSEKAILKLEEKNADKDGGTKLKLIRAVENLTDYVKSRNILKQTYDNEIKKLNEREDDQLGQGMANKDFCPQKKDLANVFLATYNPGLQQKWDEYLKITRQQISDDAYWSQYVLWADQFEVKKINLKIAYLRAIKDASYQSITSYECNPIPIEPKVSKLGEFDDMHCEYHSNFTCPVGSIRIDCSRMTTELDLKIIKLGLKQDMNKETFGDQYMSCSVELSTAIGVGFNKGPLKAEVSAGVGAKAEFDRNGLKDFILKASAGISVGTDVMDGASMAGVGASDLAIDANVTGQISIISGKSSVEGGGMLEGVNKL